QEEGITRVILLDTQDTTFATAAENQNYYPKYGMGTIGVPAGFIANQPKSSPGLVGVGYDPTADLGPADNVSTGPGETLCNHIMVEYTDQKPSDALAWGIMQWQCDAFFFLRSLLQNDPSFAIGSQGQAWAQAIRAIGTSFQSASVLGTDFSTGRFDGVSKVRPFAYFANCTCIRYTGAAVSSP
ncbi:MAG TPA: hypothetical protein VFN75_08805, partial [Pseudonocardiaceae bacterium]|nr:hypothetical protein [Pseudonocardiaceae bacterium]